MLENLSKFFFLRRPFTLASIPCQGQPDRVNAAY